MYGVVFRAIAACYILLLLVTTANPVAAYYTYMPASTVVGQSNFSSSSSNQGLSVNNKGLNLPTGVASDGKILAIAEFSNNRVLIFNNLPATNGKEADVVIGQANFNNNSANQGGTPSDNTLRNPRGVFIHDSKLYIADTGNNRILVYNSIPTMNNAKADLVLGQPDMNTVTAGTSYNKFSGPYNVFTDGNLFVVSDDGNRRALIYNGIPQSNDVSPNTVVGQTDFNTATAGTSATKFQRVLNAIIAENKLLIADYGNSRVLVWNTIPTTNGKAADVVIGQQNFTTGSSNQGNGNIASADTLYWPTDISYENNRLFIMDANNFRILLFDGVPSTNNAQAKIVIGQQNFVDRIQNSGGAATPNSVRALNNLFVKNNMLIISDWLNHRVLIYLNVIQNVNLSRKIIGLDNGSLRFLGKATTNIPNHTIRQIEYSVNRGSWTGGFPTDGAFDSPHEEYFFDFDPLANTLANNHGFTLKVRATHNNDKDTGNATVFFEPFQPISPLPNAFTSNKLPSFTFSFHTYHFQDLREYLDRFRIALSPNGSDWITYIDHIPVDYDAVRLHPDNLRPQPAATSSGIYEDSTKIVQYNFDAGTITVSPKHSNNSSLLLPNGSYFWRVEALDRAEQLQHTDPRPLRIGTKQIVTSRPWFPLAIRLFGNGKTFQQVNISTVTLTSHAELQSADAFPWFKGIATADSTVSFRFVHNQCIRLCEQTFSAQTRENSVFYVPVTIALQPGTYTVTASVKDTGDNYNELDFQLTVPEAPPTPSLQP